MKPTVVVTQRIHAEVVDRLSPHANLVLNQTGQTLPPDEVRRRCRAAQAVMVFMSDCIDDAFLQACPQLRLVAGALKGYDNIDVAACARHGVAVTIVPDLLTEPTAELAVALLLGLIRNVAPADREIRCHGFRGWRPEFYGATLTGKTVAVLGMGKVGRAIARRLSGFDARLVYYDPARLPDDHEAALGLCFQTFPDVLAGADHVVLAVPLVPTTVHMIDAAALELVRAGAYLVNVGRGSVVDEAAVAQALARGRLSGYAADVFEMEDRSLANRPAAIHPELLSMSDRTLLTPHLGSAVRDIRRAIELQAADEITRLCHKQPLSDPVSP